MGFPDPAVSTGFVHQPPVRRRASAAPRKGDPAGQPDRYPAPAVPADQEVLLRAHVVVQRSGGNVRGLGDFANACSLESLCRKQPQRRTHHSPTRIRRSCSHTRLCSRACGWVHGSTSNGASSCHAQKTSRPAGRNGDRPGSAAVIVHPASSSILTRCEAPTNALPTTRPR
jgi:hypothetical protein